MRHSTPVVTPENLRAGCYAGAITRRLCYAARKAVAAVVIIGAASITRYAPLRAAVTVRGYYGSDASEATTFITRHYAGA